MNAAVSKLHKRLESVTEAIAVSFFSAVYAKKKKIPVLFEFLLMGPCLFPTSNRFTALINITYRICINN